MPGAFSLASTKACSLAMWASDRCANRPCSFTYSRTGLYRLGLNWYLYSPFSHSYMFHMPVSMASLAISTVLAASNFHPFGQGAWMCRNAGPCTFRPFRTLFIKSTGYATEAVATYFTAGWPPMTSCGGSLGNSFLPSGIADPGGVKVVLLPYGVVGEVWIPVLVYASLS